MSERLGVLGSGTIASGLATVAAAQGVPVTVYARSDDSAARTQEKLGPTAHVVTDLDELAEASFLVEAVTEDVEVKAEALARLAGLRTDGTIVATTTSSLPLDELARAGGGPERFVGFHVFNPVPKMPLVELAYLPEASDDTKARAATLCAALGKEGVEVPNVPGFVVNRLLFPFLFSAVVLLEESGMDPAALDRCLKLGAGHPMGPLALLDLVGLDVSAAIGDELGVAVPARIRELVAEGHLGRKTGRGLVT
jgi:3-hydroxybutyryl-CoA dehydrogenase